MTETYKSIDELDKRIAAIRRHMREHGRQKNLMDEIRRLTTISRKVKKIRAEEIRTRKPSRFASLVGKYRHRGMTFINAVKRAKKELS